MGLEKEFVILDKQQWPSSGIPILRNGEGCQKYLCGFDATAKARVYNNGETATEPSLELGF